jgi:hypothetical protein
MPTNTLVLPLFGGYLLIHLIPYFRFRSQRLDGYRLLIESGIAGAFLLLAGRVVTYYLHRWAVWPIQTTENWWNQWAPPVDFLASAGCSLVLGIGVPCLVYLIPGCRRDAAIAKAIERYGSSLQRMLFSASIRERPVMLTLRSRKVYVGWIVDAPNLKIHESHLKIIPMFSGYRDEHTLEVVPTQDYRPVYEKIHSSRKNFAVAIPIDDVQSCSSFDKIAFSLFLDGVGQGGAPEELKAVDG